MKRKRVFHLGLWGPRVEDGVDWEIEHHMNERIDELIASGYTRAAAEAEARRAFGNVGRIRRELRGIDRDVERRMRIGQWLETVMQDIRYGLRGLRSNPGFALALMLTLGLGIGANVAMFSVFDAMLLRPLPYAEPDELVNAWKTDAKGALQQPVFSWEMSKRLIAEQRAGQPMFGYGTQSVLYLGGSEPVTMAARTVTHGFEETLRVSPIVGRGFNEGDAQAGAEPVVLLSYGFWRNALGSDPSVVNRPIELDGKQFTVIGVMPKGFKFPLYSTSDFWLPIQDDGRVAGKKTGYLELVARVPVASLPAAQSQISTLVEGISKELTPGAVVKARFEPLDRNRVQPSVKEALIVLIGAVILILLVAGVNMINLLLMRGSARVREIGVRLALGASRSRIVRQLGTEAITMSVLSGVLAIAIAVAVLRGVRSIMPESITFFAPFAIQLETRALLFTFALTVICGLAFGLLPAFLAARTQRDIADLSRYGNRTVTRTRLRRTLVMVELALSVTLLIGAGLLMRSFINLVSIDPGFEPKNLAMMKLEISSASHPDPGERGEYLRRLEEQLEAIPGVDDATLSMGMPPHTNISFGDALQVEGKAAIPGFTVVPHADVRPDFIKVVGAKLLMGRNFTESDDSKSVIIDEDLARKLWPAGNPLGQRFRLGADFDWVTVIGVVKDLKMMGPDARESDFAMLNSLGSYEGKGGYMSAAIRTNTNPKSLLAALRNAVHQVDPKQPISDVLPATTAYASAIDMPRFLLVLISILAAIALVLASVGVYGVLAYGVNQRQHEIGVRIALGARASELNRMVLREGIVLALIGVTIGVAGALALSKFIGALLFNVAPRDPITIIIVIGTMVTCAILASSVPARRATRVNPLTAIRAE